MSPIATRAYVYYKSIYLLQRMDFSVRIGLFCQICTGLFSEAQKAAETQLKNTFYSKRTHSIVVPGEHVRRIRVSSVKGGLSLSLISTLAATGCCWRSPPGRYSVSVYLSIYLSIYHITRRTTLPPS